VRRQAARLPEQIVYLGQVAHEQVSCVLREADIYVSAAPNETYGRSLVEALRCALPIVTMESCNMHVLHGSNGLLAADRQQLARQLQRILGDEKLRADLERRAAKYGAEGAFHPEARMLQAILEARNRTLAEGNRQWRRAVWHPFWSLWLWLSVALDHPSLSMATILAVSALAMRALWPTVMQRWPIRDRVRTAEERVRTAEDKDE